MDAGINQLLTQLCSLQLGSHQNPTVAQPKLTRQQKKKILWVNSWNVLFKSLHGPHRKHASETKKCSLMSETNTLYAIAYDLRIIRKFDAANNLEELVVNLTKDGLDDTMTSVLRLLISLADIHRKDEGVIIGHEPLNLPIVFPRRGTKGVLPEGPLCHRDTRQQRKDDLFYTHFPSELFEVNGISVEEPGPSKYDVLNPSVFTTEPGSGLCGNGVFNVKRNLEDEYEKQVQNTLFGALTYSTTMTMDIVLDLPDIQDTWNTHILDLKPAKIREVSEDEGFIDRTPSTAESLASSCSTSLDGSALAQEDERDIWDLALEHKPSTHHTWERRGQPPGVLEKPYLIEAGSLAFDHLYQTYQRQLRVLDPELKSTPVRTIPMVSLVKSTLNMLIGVPSVTLRLNDNTFSIAEGTHVSGMSPEAVASALSDLLICGSQYVRLVEFSKPPKPDSHYRAGLVFQAFTVGIRKYLQHYRACVLSIPQKNTLVQVSALLDKLRKQIGVLSCLCRCNGAPQDDAADPFPTGVKLLSYLYEKAFEASSSLHYPMLLSLFHTSCGPYIMFVREWVFHGTYHDLYGEFMIQMNTEYLQCRDRHYWTHGFVYATKNLEETVPPFLKDFANDIFVCGKSINLLQLVVPKHFLLGREAETPSVSISFSEEEIGSIERQCRNYKSRMQEVARQQTKAREDMIKEKEQARQDIMLKAQKTAIEQIAKFQERIEATKKAQDKKKRAAFAELKAQMEKDKRRRATEKEQEKEEDAARIAATNRQELLEATVEEDIAKKAREELIKEYQTMTAEVAHREQKALWRVARHRLEHRRIEFLTKDESKWQAELSAKPFVPEMDEDVLEEALKLVSENTNEDVFSDAEDETGLSPVDGTTPHEQSISETLPTETKELPDDEGGQDSPTTEVQHLPSKPKHMTDESDGTESRSSIKMSDNMHATKESEPLLPRWAKEGAKTAMAPFGLEEADRDKMPSWAREELQDKDSTGVEDAADGGQRKAGGGEGESVTPGESGQVGERKRHKMTTWAASRAKMSLSEDAGLDFYKPHVSQVTKADDIQVKSSVKMSRAMTATQMSSAEFGLIPQKKAVNNVHVGMESTEEVKPMGIKKSTSMSATLQSDLELQPIARKKTVEGRHVSQQSEQQITKKTLIKMHMERHSSQQSEPPKLRVVQRSMFGHPSQMSMISNYEIIKPVVKSVPETTVFDEVDFGNFLVKPRNKTVVSMNKDRYATKESEYIDYDKIRMEKFKAMNVHGHSSDSTVQRLLYGENFGRGKISRVASLQEEHEDYDTEPWTEIDLEEYNRDFSTLDEVPVVDLMNNIGADATFASWGDYTMSARSDVSAYSYISLGSLTKRSVKAPLATQIQLVNQSLLSYYTGELEIDTHFVALRRFFLMQDGEFGQSLSEQLFEKLAQNPMPYEMLNPMYLNNVLSRALRSSIHGDTRNAGLVSFALKYIPPILNHHAPDALDCLELTYKQSSTKQAHRLSLGRLQLCRHEMQHFVKVIQGYMANQLIHVTWQEFQEYMSRNVTSIDDLHRCHTNYLDKCVSRCLLSKEAEPVMKIIKEIFKMILKFRKQLISHEWRYVEQEGISHPAYDNICHAFKIFKDYARFLFKVVSKLVRRGNQPNLQELLLRLNYNSYYSAQ